MKLYLGLGFFKQLKAVFIKKYVPSGNDAYLVTDGGGSTYYVRG